MPVQPNLLERLLFFQLNQAPAPLLDLAGALAYQALAAAAELDLFQALSEGPMEPTELAARLESDERGILALLQALEATGYVENKGSRYANSSATEKWLVGESVFDMASAARYWSAMISEMLPQAAEFIRTGRRPYRFYDWVEAEPDLAAAFQRMMVTNATLTGDTIAKKVDLPPPAGRLLDVGGGHGAFSIIFCQRYPKLRATILDSPVTLNTARERVVQHGLAGRIELVEGDMWQIPWGEGYDCVLLFNLLHHFDLDTNKKLLAYAAGALNPGGKVAILEQVEGRVNGAASNAFVRLIALQYYLFADGRVYSAGEIGRLLTESGFSSPGFHSLTKAPGSTLAVAIKE